MDKILEKKSLANWLKKLNGYDVYAPVLKDDLWNYEIISDGDKFELDYTNTVQAPKKIIFPQVENMLDFATNRRRHTRDHGNPPSAKSHHRLGSQAV